ncbi:Subtilase family protein [Eubacterium maltosivorans]|uniref:S8 family serine peptidase n=1 Tax=Eubacterium maltosivorans TaxID=2041044 RepID=UPI0008806319|nr:S8 family serine peptidase [Eubacterium maltosivorans]WPK79356.1 hypothetical protein EUMA32_07630 [Eubacterium maltosivorans]SDP78353.1 Subtilase family protein [Eubacterium maltosivorans]
MKKLLSLLLTALLLLGSLPISALARDNGSSDALTGDYVPGEAIVCVKGAGLYSRSAESALLTDAEPLMDLNSGTNAYSRSAAPAESLKLVRSDALSTAELIDELQKLDTVEFAEPNYIYTVSEGTKDLTGMQWAYDKNGDFGMAIDGWNQYKTDGTPDPAVDTSGTVVAVLDTGVDYDHEDLKSVMWTADSSLQAIIGGGQYGYNAVTVNSNGQPYDSADPMDDHSHGTHCAGIIAASWNNMGVSGATSGTQIMAVKAANDKGSFAASDSLKGYAYIQRAVENGVPVTVINNSWGGGASGKALDRAATALGDMGVVSVFAAGNESSDCDNTSRTVSTLRDNPYVIAVNATDIDGNMADFSNYGATTTDVAAPGVNILSTVPTNMGKADPRFVTAPFLEGFEDESAPKITFQPDSSTIASYSGDMAFEGSQSFKITINDAKGIIENNTIDLSATPYRYLSYMFRADSTADQTILGALTAVKVKTTDLNEDGTPKWESLDQSAVQAGSWGAAVYTLPDNTDYKNFQIQILAARVLSDAAGTGDVYIDNLGLGDTAAAYEYMNGTSMATPAVTGEVAILAKHFDDKDAAKTAARVIGSVKKIDSQKGKSVSEGLAKVDLALAENTVPVVNSAVPTGDSQLAIGGYFFGSAPTVTIDGAPAAVVSSSDESIVANLPQGMTAGVKRVEVTSEKDAGHQSFELGAVSSLYERLPLPDDARFYDTYSGSLTGLGGSLYYTGLSQDNTVELWRYTPGQTENNGWTRLNSDESIYPSSNSACTWNGRLILFSDGPQGAGISVYDPETNAWSSFTTELIADLSSPSLLNTGNELLLVGGSKTVNETETAQTAIIRVDIGSQNAEKTGDLSAARISPAVAYTADGSAYVAAGTAADGSMVDGLEKIENGQSSMVRDKILPQGLTQSQNYTGAWGTLDGGMILSGPVVTDPDSGQVTADTYTLNFDTGGFEPTGKIVNTGRVYNGVGTAYQNAFYILGETNYAENNRVFSVDRSVKTLTQPGEEREKPVDPVNPVNPATPDSPSASGNASTGFVGGNAGILVAAVILAVCAAGLLLYRKRNLG